MSRASERERRRELETLIREQQQDYAKAFERDDLAGLLRCSGGLSVAYSTLGCHALAEKWMDEYVENLERVDPGIKARIQTIRRLLPNL